MKEHGSTAATSAPYIGQYASLKQALIQQLSELYTLLDKDGRATLRQRLATIVDKELKTAHIDKELAII